MSEIAESVVRMANQIARNFAVRGEAEAIEATAEHISLFWDRRMKIAGIALLAEPDNGYSATARTALELLAEDMSHSLA